MIIYKVKVPARLLLAPPRSPRGLDADLRHERGQQRAGVLPAEPQARALG